MGAAGLSQQKSCYFRHNNDVANAAYASLAKVGMQASLWLLQGDDWLAIFEY